MTHHLRREAASKNFLAKNSPMISTKDVDMNRSNFLVLVVGGLGYLSLSHGWRVSNGNGKFGALEFFFFGLPKGPKKMCPVSLLRMITFLQRI